MSRFDTSLGGEVRSFDTTQWSRILQIQQGGPGERRAALESLILRYWKPVYHAVRRQWHRTSEDSKDIAQEFFFGLVEGDAIDRLTRERGRFRAFLKVALRNFMLNRGQADRALKRGGDRSRLPLQDLREEDVEWAGAIADPADALDVAWRRELLAGAFERLREHYRAEGKDVYFEVFRLCVYDEAAEPDRAAVAARLGLTDIDVKNHLVDARRRYGGFLRDLVAETVGDPAGFRDEMRELFGDAPLP